MKPVVNVHVVYSLLHVHDTSCVCSGCVVQLGIVPCIVAAESVTPAVHHITQDGPESKPVHFYQVVLINTLNINRFC